MATNSNISGDLVDENLGIAEQIALRLKRRYSWVQMEDLYSYSLLSLTMAADIFDINRGVPFASFASQKGMFLAIDEMRKDGLLRRKDSNIPKMYNFSDATGSDEDSGFLGPEIPDTGHNDDMESLEVRDLCRVLLRDLSFEDRQLLVDYYSEHRTFREISEKLGISESTACLRHKALIEQLRRISSAMQVA